jgi:L-lactate utilization protein LutC
MAEATKRVEAKPQAEEKKPGLLESLKQAARQTASRMVSEIGAELVNQAAHGAHEAASALFRGDGFVMYPRGSQRNDQELGGSMTLDQLRGYAADRAKEAEHRMEHQNDRQHGGPEL